MPLDIDRTTRYVLAAYFVAGAVLVVFSFLPGGRVWGVNLFAFFPRVARYALIAVILLIPVAAALVARGIATNELSANTNLTKRFFLFAVIFTLASVVLYYLFRASTQFGGDGYAVIANLASPRPLLKYRNFGAVMLQFGLYALLGKGGSTTALLVFQLISYVSGALFLVLSILLARELFERMRDRILFALGMAVGGYALLFFGYAEDYPLFIVSVILYLYVGVLTIRSGQHRWLILLVNTLALVIHVFGLMLVPATVYILVRRTRFSGWIADRTLSVKIVLAIIPVGLLLGCFFYLFYTNYFFRFAFLPILPDRFTVNGYTMFSGRHLLDILNLIVMLVPGLLVYIAVAVPVRHESSFHDDTNVFAAIAAACVSVVIFVFDPKLGMARDWDLFGFAGVPINFLLLLLALRVKASSRSVFMAVFLAVGLGGVFLGARVAIKRDDNVAIERLRSYTPLNPIRNNKNGLLISKYYLNKGDSSRGLRIDSVWERGNREITMTAYGKALEDSGRADLAMRAYREAIAINPFEPLPYNNLGHLFIRLQEPDSAKLYLSIAQGLRPEGPLIKSNLGWIAFEEGDDRKAEKLWLEAIDLNPKFLTPQMFLLELYKKENNVAKYMQRLPVVAEYPDAPVMVLVEASLNYYQSHQYSDARRLWARAVALGLDSAKCAQVLQKYPELREKKPNNQR